MPTAEDPGSRHTLASISVRFMTAVDHQMLKEQREQRRRLTILNLPDASLDIVKRQVADLVLQTVEVHVSGVHAARALMRLRSSGHENAAARQSGSAREVGCRNSLKSKKWDCCDKG
jgi:hypothetical protein